MRHLLRAAGVALVAASAAGGQERERRSYGAGDGEGKLMLYYSSALAFSPLGTAASGPSNRRRFGLEVGAELSYVPQLSARQRTVSSDKPQATNLAPAFGRPRIAVTTPGQLVVEASWIPPVRVFDVKANVASAAISRSFAAARLALIPRLSILGGRVEGPITCNAETARDGGTDLQTYYAFVCHGNDSRDFFEPFHAAGEVLIAPRTSSGPWRPYASIGARYEKTEFDIGVLRSDGSRDTEHPVLEISTTRAYGTAGVSWLASARSRVAFELYYAPGSVFTARVLAGVRPW